MLKILETTKEVIIILYFVYQLFLFRDSTCETESDLFGPFTSEESARKYAKSLVEHTTELLDIEPRVEFNSRWSFVSPSGDSAYIELKVTENKFLEV